VKGKVRTQVKNPPREIQNKHFRVYLRQRPVIGGAFPDGAGERVGVTCQSGGGGCARGRPEKARNAIIVKDSTPRLGIHCDLIKQKGEKKRERYKETTFRGDKREGDASLCPDAIETHRKAI